jgi:hypothetical protein
MSPLLLFSSQVLSMATPAKPNIYDVIDALVASPPRDRQAVERIFGASLSRVSSGDFDSYEARDVVLDDVTLDLIDFRAPARPNHNYGPLLALSVSGRCIAQSDLIGRYGFDSVRTPSGHSAEEPYYWTRHEPWGELSFGFMTAVPESCLKDIVFEVHPRGHTPSAR